ncbi:hypothetical protein GGS20DRAFT_287551 [Poronia punctata]|nr:hypothetical protein GGS20DRAFT_287551 [Poronia punctata]
MPVKSRRVRTGCLTCRERHLKCDEGTPDCKNCRKSNRECKRGVRLNFIDLTCKEPPYIIPQTDGWTVEFQDESRLIASEYQGGIEKYARFGIQLVTPPRESQGAFHKTERPPVANHIPRVPTAQQQPAAPDNESRQALAKYALDAQTYSNKNNGALYGPPIAAVSNSPEYGTLVSDRFASAEVIGASPSLQPGYKSSDVSTAHSVAGTGVWPSPTLRELNPGAKHETGPERRRDTPPVPFTGKSGQREYLNSPEEVHFMRVFVSEVGLWMDSLDKEKHFSRLIPYHALKCPMLLNAILACGVRHLTLTQQYSDEKALFYYDTATTQLLRSLQNPERNTTECAVTAVVLNVYEIMSEESTHRMRHIAGARALIRECGWDAKSDGLGAACFWLNVGMELLSCLAFNWSMSWGPETWGVDMDFAAEKGAGTEEIWVHRIFYIVAKIANFRATQPIFKEPSPHDEQLRVQARMIEWNHLKAMCKEWEDACPRPMHPIGYVYPSQQAGPGKSLFPEIWLIKRAAVVGRLYYHMALCILAQVNPSAPGDSEDAIITQQHHAHQVCGIAAHNRDRGVASVSIRALALVSEVLTDYAEQREVVAILERTDRETGWKLAGVVADLRKRWRWDGGEKNNSDPQTHQLIFSPNNNEGGYKQQHLLTASSSAPSQQMMLVPTIQVPQQQMQPIVESSASTSASASRPIRNPFSFADFSHPNHPYRNWYEPPSRSSSYNNLQGLL